MLEVVVVIDRPRDGFGPFGPDHGGGKKCGERLREGLFQE